MATSTIRRKPLHTYKSPSAYAPAYQPVKGPHVPGKSPQVATRAQSHTSNSSGDASILRGDVGAIRQKLRKGPPLPLYHPLGKFALSLPQLDPSVFGLPNRVTIDDGVEQSQDSGRRSSSRARRPAAKVRDRERDGAEDVERAGTPVVSVTVTTNTSAKEASAKERPSSPRKRRAGGAGSGAGAKRRKRQEPEETDGVYPPPAKRTRNARGAANTAPLVASPLVSAAVAAPIEEEAEAVAEAEVEAEAAVEEAPAEEAPTPQPKRSARTRKPRASTNKRRSSNASASTNTSTSGSVAANTRSTRSAKAEKRNQEAASDAASNGEKKEEAVDVPTATAEDSSVVGKPVGLPDAGEPGKDDTEEGEAMDVTPVVVETKPPKEEKEEGELSDEPEGNTPFEK